MAAINIPFGGWGKDPSTGKVRRYWGGNVFTDGEDPTGGKGPNWQGGGGGAAPSSPSVLSAQTSPTDLASQYLGQLGTAQGQYNDILKDYLGANTQAAGFEQKLLDSIKQAGQYPSASAYRQEYSQNPNLTPMAIEALVSGRVNTTGGTIQDMISRANTGVQTDLAGRQQMLQMAQQPISNLLQQYQLAQSALPPQTSQAASSFGGGGSAITGGGASLYDIASQIEQELGGGQTAQPAAQSSVSPYQDYFNQHPYGMSTNSGDIFYNF